MRSQGGDAVWYVALLFVSAGAFGATVNPISHAGPDGHGDVPRLTGDIARTAIARSADRCEPGFDQGCVTLLTPVFQLGRPSSSYIANPYYAAAAPSLYRTVSNKNYDLNTGAYLGTSASAVLSPLAKRYAVRGFTDANWADLGVATISSMIAPQDYVVPIAHLTDIRIRRVTYASASSHLADVTWDAVVGYTPVYHAFFSGVASKPDYAITAIRHHAGTRIPPVVSTFQYGYDFLKGRDQWQYDPADRGSSLFTESRSTVFLVDAAVAGFVLISLLAVFAFFRYAPWIAIPLTIFAIERVGKE